MILSPRTRHCRKLSTIYTVLHLLCLFGPLLYFVSYGLIIGEIVSKVALSLTVIVSIILAAISFIVGVKHKAGLHRTILWTLISGVLFCLTQVKPFIWIMSIASILDELIFIRLKDKYKTLAQTNREIDLREQKQIKKKEKDKEEEAATA